MEQNATTASTIGTHGRWGETVGKVEKCGHPGKVWTEGDQKWQCMACGHEERFECKHEMRTAMKGAGAGFEWCASCKRPVVKQKE
jgi:hypothetical protein